MSGIKISPNDPKSINRAHAMNPSLLKANEEWNKFVEKNRGWIEEYRTRMQNITQDTITVDSVIKERLEECFAENMPLSGEFLRLRKQLMAPENLPSYKQKLDQMTLVDSPAPYYRDLLLDEDVREEIDRKSVG